MTDPQEEACSADKPSSGGLHPPKLFSRVGGTVMLPAPPVPGPYQATGGALELGVSQGYSQMSGGRNQLSPSLCLSLLPIIFWSLLASPYPPDRIYRLLKSSLITFLQSNHSTTFVPFFKVL